MGILTSPPSPALPDDHHWNRNAVLLAAASTVASFTQEQASQHSLHIAFLFPVLRFVCLLVGGIWLKQSGSFGSNSGSRDEEVVRKKVGQSGSSSSLIGVLAALDAILGIVQGRWVHTIVWMSLEVYLLPALLLIPYLRPQLQLARPNSTTGLIYAISAIATGFSLIGSPLRIGIVGLALSIAAIAVKAVLWTEAWKLLKEYEAGAAADELIKSGLVALATSIPPFLVAIVLPSDRRPILLFTPILYLIAVTLASIHTIALLNSSTPFQPATLLPLRSFAILVISATPFFSNIFARPTVYMQLVYVTSATCYFFHRPLPSSFTSSSTLNLPALGKSHLLLLFAPLVLLPFPMSFGTATLPAHTPFSAYSPAYLPPFQSLDLVFSYHDEPLPEFKHHLDRMLTRWVVRLRRKRVVVYNKGSVESSTIRRELGLRYGDLVINIPNTGRESGSYLLHIKNFYNGTLRSSISSPSTGLASTTPIPRTERLADHTFFLQPHMAWAWIAHPRIEQIKTRTGFAHLAPLVRSDCGVDGRGEGDYPMVKEMYNMFSATFCGPEGQLTAWAGQFHVSLRRIMRNPYERYAMLESFINADKSHWIHTIWGPRGTDKGDPVNPAIGHSVERAWPMIFGCDNVKLAEECDDEEYRGDRCFCWDD